MMQTADYQRLMRIAIQERAKGIAEIERKFRLRVDAIREVWELANLKEQLVPEGELDDLGQHGGLMLRVQEAVRHLEGVFTHREVAQLISARVQNGGDKVKPSSVSAALKRLVGSAVELVEQGAGKRPSTYRRRADGMGLCVPILHEGDRLLVETAGTDHSAGATDRHEPLGDRVGSLSGTTDGFRRQL